MALIKCPECSNDVSDKASSCPKCGYPIQSAIPLQTPDLKLLVTQCLLRDGKIAAIKLYRDQTGAPLMESKQYVERLESTLPPGAMPKSSRRGCFALLVFGALLVSIGVVYLVWSF
ncbi:MAG: Zinc-ribbon protein [Verrucomicrobiales bacterium]|nr:Zinc-ribbon protein [Verrucomicrobiales bacterium]